MIDFAEIKAGIEYGELYEFNAKMKKFVRADNNVLGIGVHGQEGYECARVLVQLGDLIVAFRQDEEDVAKFVLADNALGGEEIYPFLIADNVVYSTSIAVTNETAEDLVIHDQDGCALKDEDGHYLLYEPENPLVMPFMALKDLAEGVLKEEEFTIIAAEADMPAEEEPAAEEDLGTLADLESFGQSGNEILLEDQELNIDPAMLLTEDDLPSPADLDAEKDFSENI